MIPDKERRGVSRGVDLPRGRSCFFDDFQRGFLCAHPTDPHFVILANRFPKTAYESLLIATTWDQQCLTQRAVASQIELARQQVVLEFHRTHRYVDHFHAHIYLAADTPVGEFAADLLPLDEQDGLTLGRIGKHDRPYLPHICLSSSDPSVLARGTMSMVGELESQHLCYMQNVVQGPNGKVHVLFFILAREPEFGLSTSGFLAASADLSNAELWNRLADVWDERLLSDIRDRFVAAWRHEQPRQCPACRARKPGRSGSCVPVVVPKRDIWTDTKEVMKQVRPA